MVSVKRLISTSSSSDSDSSSSDSGSSSSDGEDAGSKRATYHQWRSYLMKMDSQKNGTTTSNYHKNGTTTSNYHKNGAPTPGPIQTTQNTQSVLNRIKATPAAINPIRTVTPALTRTITSAPNVTTVSSPISRSKPTALAPKHTRTVVQAIKNVNTVPPTSKGIQTVTPELSASLRSIYETFWSLNSAAKLIHVKSQLDEPSKIYVHKLIKAHSNLVQENSRLKKEKQDLINVIKKIGIAISNETIANLIDPARSTQPKNS